MPRGGGAPRGEAGRQRNARHPPPPTIDGRTIDITLFRTFRGHHYRGFEEEVLVSREGPIVTLTFNRPEARNAMTWGMYQRLYEVCEEVDGDDSIRVLVLKGAGGKAFVAGTDISQFTKFKDGEDGIKYEKDGDKRSGRISKVKKPVIAQIEGVCVGGGFGIAAGADIRIGTPESRFGLPIARTLGNCLSMGNYATLHGPDRPVAPEGNGVPGAPDGRRRGAHRRASCTRSFLQRKSKRR